MRSFKRKRVGDNEYLRSLVCYIHNNPVKDGLVPFTENWAFSSYRELLKASEFDFRNDPVLGLFGSRKEFIEQHRIFNSPGSLDIPYATAS